MYMMHIQKEHATFKVMIDVTEVSSGQQIEAELFMTAALVYICYRQWHV